MPRAFEFKKIKTILKTKGILRSHYAGAGALRSRIGCLTLRPPERGHDKPLASRSSSKRERFVAGSPKVFCGGDQVSDGPIHKSIRDVL